MSWKSTNMNLSSRRVKYKGTKEQLPKVQVLLDEQGVTRKTMYLILKYFELTPDGLKTLGIQFPDV